MAGKRFVKRVHQIMDSRIVHIYAQNLRHLAGSFAFSSGACHKQRLKDTVRRVDQVSVFAAQRLVKRKRKAIAGLGKLLYRFWVCLRVQDVRERPVRVADFPRFIILIHRVRLNWV